MGELILKGLELKGTQGRETDMADWRNGKSFQVTGGPLVTINDLKDIKAEGFTILEFKLSTGLLLERVILDDKLRAILSNNTGEFSRVH